MLKGISGSNTLNTLLLEIGKLEYINDELHEYGYNSLDDVFLFYLTLTIHKN